MCFAEELTLVYSSPWRTIPVKGELLPMVGDTFGTLNTPVRSVNWTPAHVSVNGVRHSKSTALKSKFTTF